MALGYLLLTPVILKELSLNVLLHIVCYTSETALALTVNCAIDQLFYQDLNGRIRNPKNSGWCWMILIGKIITAA
jgi:hypothetical protein